MAGLEFLQVSLTAKPTFFLQIKKTVSTDYEPQESSSFGRKIFELRKSIWNPKVLCQHKVLQLSLRVTQQAGQESSGPVHSMSFPPWLTAVVGSGGAGGGLLPLPPLPFPLLLLESPGSGQGEVALKEEGQTFC